MEHRQALRIGMHVGDFEILSVLGVGGFGVTYLARDRNLLDRRVLKEFFPAAIVERTLEGSLVVRSERDREAFDEGLGKFLAEARIASALKHPAIVRVTSFFRANETGYFAMAYEPGETLAERLGRESAQPPEAQVLELLKPLVEALKYIHARRLIHRDIKPANILLRDEGGPLLIDFGAARPVSTGSTPRTAILTMGYAPPEQYVPDAPQGPFTDVYALAAVAYRMIVGRAPTDAIERIQGTGRPFISAQEIGKNLGYSSAFLAAIDHALELRFEQRTPDAAQFWAELSGAVAPPPRTANPPSASRSIGSKVALGTAASLVLAGIIVVYLGLRAPDAALRVAPPGGSVTAVEPPPSFTFLSNVMQAGQRGGVVREKPERQGKEVGRLSPGASVTVLESTDGEEVSGSRLWQKIRTAEGVEGFVTATNLQPLGQAVDLEYLEGAEAGRAASDFLRCEKGLPPDFRLATGVAELNGKPGAERVVKVVDPAACGSAGCDGDLIRILGSDNTPISSDLGCNEVELAGGITKGYRNFYCVLYYSGMQERMEYAWSGETYQPLSTPGEDSAFGEGGSIPCAEDVAAESE